MADDALQPVYVSRTIKAPAQRIFDLLARPDVHPRIDGSGMLRASTGTSAGAVITGLGDVFTMAMHNDELGDYEMANHVVEFEPGRRIGWEPVLKSSSRPEDQDDIGQRAEYRWSYELTPLGDDETLVTEAYDCRRAPQWLRTAVKGGNRWVNSMTRTLEKLDALSREPAGT